MNSSDLLGGISRVIRTRSREIALIVVLLLINYLIFSRLGVVILTGQRPTPTPTRTPKPTFTPSQPVATTPTLPPGPASTTEATPAPSPTPISHVVQAGDTLSEIACIYSTSVQAIVQANDLDNANAIREGQVLLIPSPSIASGEETAEPVPTLSSSVGQRIHVVQPAETLSEIARMYSVSWQEIARANGLDNPNAIQVGQALVIP